MGKLPCIHFYPGDWLRDQVAGCSLAAQGLWLRMMMVMHDSDRYGYLSINGVAIPPGHVAARCGVTLEQYTTLLDELDSVGVPRRTAEGIIYSKRMVDDAKLRTARAKAGSKGGKQNRSKPPSKIEASSELLSASSSPSTSERLSLDVDSAVDPGGHVHGEREKPPDANDVTATASDVFEAWRLWVQVHGSVHGKPPPLDEPRMLREVAAGVLARVGREPLASAYRAFLQDGKRGKVSMPTYAMFWHPEKPATREHYLTQATKAAGDAEARAAVKRDRDIREALKILNGSTLKRVERPDKYDFEAAYFEAAWEDFARRNGCRLVGGKWALPPANGEA